MTDLSHRASASRGRREILLAAAIYFCAVLIAFGDVLLGPAGRIISEEHSDVANQFLYWREFGFGELAKGHLVLWNPHLFSGAPFLGGFQSALLYPPNWIYLVLPIDRAINLDFAISVLLAGMAMFLWARHRRLHPAGSILAGWSTCSAARSTATS